MKLLGVQLGSSTGGLPLWEMSFRSGTKGGEKNGLFEEEQFRPDRRGCIVTEERN